MSRTTNSLFDISFRVLCGNTLLHLPEIKTSLGQSTFQYSAAADWNKLQRSIREIKSLIVSKVYSYLRELYRTMHRCSCLTCSYLTI